MKRTYIGILSAVVLAANIAGMPLVAAAQATTTTEGAIQSLITTMQGQVNDLMKQIDALRVQLNNVRQAERSLASSVKLLRQLRQGMSGEDIRTLQALLATDLSIYPDGLITGFYGPKTRAAIIRFQLAHGLSGVGTVGPLTLAALNAYLESAGSNRIPPGLLKKFIVNSGGIASSTPSGERKVTVCHKSKETITIGAPALNAHLQHGDTLGACGSIGGGDGGGTGTTTDTVAPGITGLLASSTVPTVADISWTTNEDAFGTLWYGTTSPVLENPLSIMSTESATSTFHSFSLTGLTASTTYYYLAVSADIVGNTSTTSEQTFVTVE